MMLELKSTLTCLIGASSLLVSTGCNTFETRAPRRAPLAYPGSPQAARPLEGPSNTSRVTPVPVAQPRSNAYAGSSGNRTMNRTSNDLVQQDLQANATFRNEMRMQLDQIMAENARMNAELMSLRRSQSQPNTASSATDAEIRLLKSRIDGLEAQLRAVEATANANSGQIQKIPGKIDSLLKKYQGSAASSGGGARRATTPKPPPTGSQTGYEHIVATGETLSAIASAYEVSARKIIEANHLTDPDNLKVNQKLFIPE